MAIDNDSKATLIRNDDAWSRSGRRTSSWTLPPDLLAEAVRRLRAVALLYALAYFLAGLSFEVLGSFGIAAAEYHHITAPISHGALGAGDFGLSWVAVWVMLSPWSSPRRPGSRSSRPPSRWPRCRSSIKSGWPWSPTCR